MYVDEPPGADAASYDQHVVQDVVREIEEAFVAQWSLIGSWPGARLLDEGGVLRFETPIRRLPYNGVIRTRITGDADREIGRVVAAYADRQADFYWVVQPSSEPTDLPDRLGAAGLRPVERATGMSLDLDAPPPRPSLADGVEIVEVADAAAQRDYEDILMAYWELDESDRPQVARMNRWWSGERAQGRRWLARLDGDAVGKAYLSLAGPPAVASIYGMSVLPRARGRGIAGALTGALVAQARELGCRRVVLHSTEMAVGVYRRAGFVERCSFEFFATAPIWSRPH